MKKSSNNIGKIAIYCDCMGFGGAQRVTLCLVEYFMSLGIVCDIVTTRKLEKEYNISPKIKRINISNDFTSRWKCIGKIREIMKKNKYELVIVMGLPDSFYVILALLFTKIKVVISERNDPSHFDGSCYIKTLSRFMMRFADGFVFQTEEAKKYFQNIIGHRGYVIPNPILVETLPEIYKGEKKNKIITIGRLTEQKNQEMMIRVFKTLSLKYPDYILEVYGDGHLKNFLINLISVLDLSDKVFLRGSYPDVWEKCKDAKIFLLTSDYEGMPNVLIEAMAMGLTCVSTDCPCGGPRELIQHGKNGFLISVRNELELYKILTDILENQSQSKKISMSATDIREKLKPAYICNQWLMYINSL